MGVAAANFFDGPSRSGIVPPAVDGVTHHSVRRLGEAYLRLRPMESNRARLMAALRRDLRQSGYGLANSENNAGLEEGLRALIKDDFAAGRTIIVDGWVLSESECRLCAVQVTG